MEITVLNQTSSFLYSALTGFVAGMIYEFFKCVKYIIFKNKISRDIVDVVFVFVSAVFLFFSFYTICALSFRLYHILGFILGLIIFFNSVNSFVYNFFEKILIIFKFFSNILLYPVKLFSKIILKIVFTFIKVMEVPFKYVKFFFLNLKSGFVKIVKRKKKV